MLTEEIVERIAKTKESYDEKFGNFVILGVCPFCKVTSRVHNGKQLKGHGCKHFAGERHGCGGTIFVFEGPSITGR